MLLLRNALSVLVLFVLNIRYRLASQEDGLSKKLTAGNSTDLIPGIPQNPYPGGVK